MIIAVTGTIASGKGKIAEILKKKGFEHHSFSMEIRAIARERGIEVNRETLSKLGKDLRDESPKESILAKRILEKVSPGKDYVLDGIRDMDEVCALRDYGKKNSVVIVIVGVDADPEIRFERLKSRGRHGDPETFEAFKRVDSRERKGGGGQEVGKVLKNADFLLDNSGSLEELEMKLEGFLVGIHSSED